MGGWMAVTCLPVLGPSTADMWGLDRRSPGLVKTSSPVASFSKLITAVVMKNWKEIVESCDLKNWREALAAVLTYAKPDEFSALCGKK